jgi:biopolymer transport protein ExbD
MAEISDNNSSRGKNRRRTNTRIKLDMTPMVDLAFLLLTFFVLSATFSKPSTMEVVYPAQPKDSTTDKIKNGITFLVSEDKLYYYEGEFKPQTTQLKSLQKGTLSSYLSEKCDSINRLMASTEEHFRQLGKHDSIIRKEILVIKKLKENPTFLVKADEKASYKNMVDVIDEINHQSAGKYVICELNQAEYRLMSNSSGTR